MATSNIEMEGLEENKIETNKTINMYKNIKAFLKLIKSNRIITPYDAIDIADEINRLEGISKGFRKVQVEVRIANFFPIASYMVPQAIYNLFDNYNNTWSDLDVYEKRSTISY